MMFVRDKPYRTNLAGTMRIGVMKRAKVEFGVSWGAVMLFMQETRDEDLLADLLCDERFQAWMWAWMVNAGAELSRGDIEALTVDDVRFGPDDVAADPQAPPDPTPASDGTGSAAAGATRPRRAAKKPGASTRTSRKRS